MASIRGALTQTFATNYLQLALQIVGLVVLARLLGPEETGIYTIAAVFVGFAQDLRSFAMGHYIIQEPDLTKQRMRAAFSVSLALGFTAALILYLAAPYAGAFYDEEGVTAVLSLLAVNFLLTPFGIVVMSYFRRNLQFGRVMLVETASSVVRVVTAILLAYLGFSYMSLAWAPIAGTVTTLVLIQLIRPAGIPWLPGIREIKRVLSFGLYMTSSTMMGRVGTDIPNLIVGKILDLSAVGLISRGSGLIQIFHKTIIQGIRPVIMPFLSAKQRSGKELGTSYLYTVTCVTGLAWPFYISLAILADPVVHVVLGSKWTALIPLLSIWPLAPAIGALTPFAQDVFVATGNVKRFLRLQTYMALTRVVIVAGAAFHSLEALIVAFAVSQAAQRAIIAPAIHKLVRVDRRRHQSALSPSLIVTACTGVGAFLTTVLLPPAGALLQLGAGGLGALLGWFIGCRVTRHPLMNELGRAMTAIRRRVLKR